MLLNHGAEHSAVNSAGRTPWDCAENGRVRALLRAHGAGDLRSEVFEVARNGNEGRLDGILKSNRFLARAVGKGGTTPLHLAASEGVAKLLLAYGADVDARAESGITALIEAATAGREEVVGLLLDSGADVGAKTKAGATALCAAARAGNRAVAELLICERGRSQPVGGRRASPTGSG
jgi:ankyrin repeat protein